jgi:NADH-quinone oxidoreductase subunit J
MAFPAAKGILRIPMVKLFSWLVAYWYLVLPLVLGFVAILTLLPHTGKKRGPVQLGLACGVLALMFTGLLLIRSSGHLALDLFFMIFAAVAVCSAAAMIIQHNPVYSALYFALVVLSVCGLFLLKSASFLAAATIIVYAGAIIVTFLFVIMLAQQTGLADYDRRSREAALSCIAGFILLGALLFVVEKNFSTKANPALVQAALTDALDQTAPGRFPRSGSEIAEVLQIQGKPGDQAMRQLFEGLASWPDAESARKKADAAWAELKTNLAEDNILAARAQLTQLQQIAAELQSAQNRYHGLLAPADSAKGLSPLGNMASRSGGHVNDLGRTLFGDYLYAVELAGTLLLIATLAAILIVQQHQQRKEVPA